MEVRSNEMKGVYVWMAFADFYLLIQQQYSFYILIQQQSSFYILIQQQCSLSLYLSPLPTFLFSSNVPFLCLLHLSWSFYCSCHHCISPLLPWQRCTWLSPTAHQSAVQIANVEVNQYFYFILFIFHDLKTFKKAIGRPFYSRMIMIILEELFMPHYLKEQHFECFDVVFFLELLPLGQARRKGKRSRTL